MIRQSVKRFFQKIMHNKKLKRDDDSTKSHHALGPTRKTVVGPILAADAVVDIEQPVGVVASLDLEQARVVCAPQSLLPVGLEVIALVDVGA